MLVLGLGGFMHDYNCALVDLRRRKVAMCEAERLSRRKHHVIQDGEDLLSPILKCCKDLGRRPRDIDTVVFAHTDPFPCKERLRKILPVKRFIEVDHHLCHAAAGFYSSGLDSALIVSLDGFGDGSSGLVAEGRGKEITELLRIAEQDSLGLEYLRATVHLGLGGYGSEGKTQGLAPYGEPMFLDDYLNEVEILPDGNLRFSEALKGDGSRLAEEGGYINTMLLHNSFLPAHCPRRIPPEPLQQVHMDLAASIQALLEHFCLVTCRIYREKTQLEDLVLTGGVAMNSSMNGRIMESGLFRRVFALPMASDRGTALGAALYHVHHQLGEERFFELKHVFYGNEYGDRQVLKAIKRAGLSHRRSEDIADEAALLLAKGKIVGWFQGRSEVGARALGHRSILADPRDAEMKDIINAKVKHREWFRPFAPSVLSSKSRTYFDYAGESLDLSYMTFTVPAKGNACRGAPAVVHVDGSARIQAVEEHADPLYARLISSFERLTGLPMVLNTSFNDKGEPIVESPRDAIATFLKTDMDVLCMGEFICWKDERART